MNITDPKEKDGLLMKQIDEVINCHLHQSEFDFRSIGQKTKISTSKLYSVIKSHYRDTPGRYLLKRRLDNAKGLLVTTQLGVNQIYQRSGFSDYFYFIMSFKARFGKTPDEMMNCDNQDSQLSD